MVENGFSATESGGIQTAYNNGFCDGVASRDSELDTSHNTPMQAEKFAQIAELVDKAESDSKGTMYQEVILDDLISDVRQLLHG